MKTNILQEADALVNGQRQDDYGNVSDNFNQIAKLWSVVLEKEVTAQQVALCMVQVKIARQLHKPKRDNLVDGAGYLACIEKMEDEHLGKYNDLENAIGQMDLPVSPIQSNQLFIKAFYGLNRKVPEYFEVTDPTGRVWYRGSWENCKEVIKNSESMN